MASAASGEVPSDGGDASLLDALRQTGWERLTAVRVALAAGACASGPAVLRGWADTSSSPHVEMAVLTALEKAGQNCAQSMAASPKDAGHPLVVAAETRNLSKVSALIDRVRTAADLAPLVDFWLRREALSEPELALFDLALALGAVPSQEAMGFSLRFLEDTDRLLRLVRAGRLAPQGLVGPYGMSLGPLLVMHSSRLDWQAWIDVGVDFLVRMSDGCTAAGHLLRDMGRWSAQRDGAPIRFDHFRWQRLVQLTEALTDRFDWNAVGADGLTHWEQISALPLDLSHPVAQAWWSWVQAQHLKATLSDATVAPNRQRPRL